MWSTKPPLNSPKKYCPFKIKSQDTHGTPRGIDKFPNENTLVVGTSLGAIQLFSYDLREINEIHKYEYAHGEAINSISVNKSANRVWASASADKDCLIWDKAKEKPATGLLVNHKFDLTAVHWTTEEEARGLVIIGDEVGNVMTVDLRKPKAIVSELRVANRGVQNFYFNGNNRFGVITDTSIAKIYDIDASGALNLVHENSDAPALLHSFTWDIKDPNVYYIVGQEKFAKKVTIT